MCCLEVLSLGNSFMSWFTSNTMATLMPQPEFASVGLFEVGGVN